MASVSSASSASVASVSSASSASSASVASVASAAASPKVKPAPIARVPLDPDYPLTFLAGTTFNFGASATVAGNIALGAPAAAYAGTGIGPLTMDPSGQFCKFDDCM